MWTAILLSCASVALAQGQNASGAERGGKKMWVYIGTYTNGKSQGIYLLEMDPNTGTLGEPRLAGKSENPSFLAIHPSRKFLYAVNEVGNYQGQSAGAISAFAIDPQSGGLTPLNQQSSRGAAPCHVIVDRAGKNVLAAN